MKLTYIFHSGFAVETQSCVLVPRLLDGSRRLYAGDSVPRVSLCILVSHFHEDHFSFTFAPGNKFKRIG